MLIGDHKQLQPATNCEALELRKQFGLSLFERLASNGMAVCTLTHQRRMHPELTLLHSWIYQQQGIDIKDSAPGSRAITTLGGCSYDGAPGVMCTDQHKPDQVQLTA